MGATNSKSGFFAALALVIAALLCLAAPASAREAHIFSGAFGEAGSGPGQLALAEHSGLAVDESSHDLYVADTANNRVERFSAAGAFLGSFDASTAPTGALSSPTAIAVDNSSDPLDPSAGDVYVLDAGHSVIDKFSPTGAYLGQLTEAAAGSAFDELDGVAVDPAGRVWVYQASKEIDEFSDALANAFLSQRQSPFGTNPGFAVDSADNLYVLRGEPFVAKLSSAGEQLIEAIDEEPTSAVAVDLSNDQVYIDNLESVGVFATTSSTATLVERFGAGHLSAGAGVAIDSASGTAYVADSAANVVDVFATVVLPDATTGASSAVGEETATLTGEVNPDGLPVTGCEFEYGLSAEYGEAALCGEDPIDEIGSGTEPVPVSADLTALEPRTVYHYRLLAANANGTTEGADRTFTTTAHISIDAESVADVTATSATLSAEINPGALPSTYRFEYGPTTAYGTSLPIAGGDAGSGIADVLVRAHPQDLQPNTLYHFRVLASNALGPVQGADREFTTQPRGGGPLKLPDGRAYELVSPPEKNGGAVSADNTDQVSSWESSPDGDTVAYSAPQPFADAQTGAATGQYYLAAHNTLGGWSSRSLLPPQAPGCNVCQPQIEMYSADLSKALLVDGGGQGLGQDQPPLVAGEPQDNPNLFLRDNSSGAYQLVDLTPPAATPAQANLAGASSELSHVVFNENAQLSEDAPSGENLYEWVGGTVRLISILPEAGGPAAEAQLGNGANRMRAVSADGSRIFFTADGNLYLREDGTRSVQLDAPKGGPGSGGGGQFMTAGAGGSEAFFSDDASAGLTADTAPESGANLYRFDAPAGALTDLTAAAKAEVLGVLGASEDGSYVYFVAAGALATAAPGEPEPTPGEPNLYLHHGGATTFIATLDPEDRFDWEANHEVDRTARLTPDGRHIAFESIRPLSGYDNAVAGGAGCGEGLGERCPEVFEYDAEANELTCASCNPSGVAPLGPSRIGHHVETGFQAEGYLSRNLSDDGTRLFFESSDALLPAATNGRQNVYEHEQDGAGGCAQAGGCLYLISTGRSGEDSFFEDASASGDDVFFTSGEQLVPGDVDSARDLYDARVRGGLSEPPAPAPCEGEACRGLPSTSPALPAPASAGFTGPGNHARHRHRRRGRHHHKHSGHRGGPSRGGQR